MLVQLLLNLRILLVSSRSSLCWRLLFCSLRRVRFLTFICFCSPLLSPASFAIEFESPPAIEPSFEHCIKNFQITAKSEGYPESIYRGVLGNLHYVKRVIELDRQQPEFTETFAGYLNRRVTTYRIKKGRELLFTHRVLLRKLTRLYGVPAQYLISFWGLETNYGAYLGKMSVLDSLATLACDPRRSAYFTAELFDALSLIRDKKVTVNQLSGSWAGAMGQTQFMPSAFRQHAIDGDGDGKIDLWGSVPDALTSAAHYLNRIGWESSVIWGREVLLPEKFLFHKVNFQDHVPLAQWRRLGITNADGTPLSYYDVDAKLLLPTGYLGPAFLVYPNFDVIMQWNRSEYYALAVGYLADQINGGGKLKRPPELNVLVLSHIDVTLMQEKLLVLGFDVGEPDGILGPNTRRAIRSFQLKNDFIADGYPTKTMLSVLGVR